MTAQTLKPPFAYYGGKTQHAARIVGLLPAHRHYVEPFAGSLAVLLAKPRAVMETVNDLDGDLMTFWRVLRDQPEALERAALLTPHSRAEYEGSVDLDGLDDLEKARRVWVRISQGRASSLRKNGWRHYRDHAGSTLGMPGYLTAYARRMPPAAERLQGVSLECRDALDVIRDYGQHPDVLLYCDPPYLATTRNSLNYRHELGDEQEHRTLADALHDCRAAVVLSGYASPLYQTLYADWRREEYTAWTGNGAPVEKTTGARTEVLWSNRELTTTLFSTNDTPPA